MPDTSHPEKQEAKSAKERFSLKLDPKLLADLEAESLEKAVSITSLIEDAVRSRKAVKELASSSLEEHFIKAAGLCAECSVMYRASTQESGSSYAYRPRKLLREVLWKWWGVWNHGKYEEGCPGWEKEIDPTEYAAMTEKVRKERAEEFLSADAGFRSVR